VNRFIGHLQVVTTNNYNTIAISTLHKSIHAKSFPACRVFTTHFLVTAPNNGYSPASVLNFHRELTANYQLTRLSQFSPIKLLGADCIGTTVHSRMLAVFCYHGNVFSKPLPRNWSGITAHLTIVA
jgi:hypothetical protein